MTIEEKVDFMQKMMGVDPSNEELVSFELAKIYLNLAEQKILNHIYPYDDKKVEIPSRYEMQQIELAIVLFNRRGAEGEAKHDENGVYRTYEDERKILATIPKYAGLPK